MVDSVGGELGFAEALLTSLRDIDTPTPASTLFNQILGRVSLKVGQTPQYADMRELDQDGGDLFLSGRVLTRITVS